MKNKTLHLNDYITTDNYDLLALSETWLNCNDNNDSYINALLPGYAIHHVDRGYGGGIELMYKKSLKLKHFNAVSYEQFESMMSILTINNTSIIISVIYRPPPSQQNGYNVNWFLDEIFRISFSDHC